MIKFDNKICLLTKHHKENQILPVFGEVWNGELITYDTFDTDSLGSFDGEVNRQLSPRECALKKAYLACELSGLHQGIGSEGSFNGIAGIGIMDEEFIAFVDIARKIEVFGVAREMVSLQAHNANDLDDAVQFVKHFPNTQAWMINGKAGIRKGIVGEESMRQALASERWPVKITPDFRAMHCPERQQVIKQATRDLIERCKANCPKCDYPGFAFDNTETGLPCELCLLPTNQIKSYAAICAHCHYSEKKAVSETNASSFYCSFCNP